MTGIRPEPVSDADLWEELVRSGKSKMQATAEVVARRKAIDARPSAGTTRSWGDSPAQKVGNVARAFGQGVTLGFGDEIQGAANAIDERVQRGLAGEAPRPFRVSAGEHIDAERTALKGFRRSNPKTAIASELAGAFVPGLLPGVREMSIVGGGALLGGTYGAGAAEGGLGERATGAAVGAGVGAGAGAGLQILGAAARPLYDLTRFGVTKAAATPTGQAIQSAGRRVGEYLTDIPVGLSTKNVGPNMTPGSTPPPNASRATAPRATDVIRDVLPRSPEERASSMMLERLRSDKHTPTTLRDVIERSSKPRGIADMAGENTLALQRWTRSVPSSARDEIPGALYDRQAGMQERLVGDLTSLSGAARKNMGEAITARAATREAEAAPMFDALRKAPPVNGAAFSEILNTPAGQQAVAQAQRIAANQRRSFPADLSNLDFDTMQNIKLAFDDLLGAGPASPLDAGGLGRNNARVVRDLKNQFLEIADQAFPGYREARDVFAGHSAVMNAMDEGRRFFQLPADEAASAVNRLSASEKEAFVEGAVNAAADKIERGLRSHNAAQRTILPTDMQKRLRLLFPDEASFEQFVVRAQEEAAMNRSLQQTVGGSQTFEKIQEGATNDDGALEMVTDGVQGRFGSMLDKLKNSAAMARVRGLNTETANNLGPMFTAGMRGDKNEIVNVLTRLAEAEQRELRRSMNRGLASRPITGGLGGAAGRQR